MKRKPINPKCWWVLVDHPGIGWRTYNAAERYTHRAAKAAALLASGFYVAAVAPYGRRTP